MVIDLKDASAGADRFPCVLFSSDANEMKFLWFLEGLSHGPTCSSFICVIRNIITSFS
jgi:hypothetical protein